MVLGLSPHEWRERKEVPSFRSFTNSKSNYDHLHNETIGRSEDRRRAIDLAIIREEVSKPQMFLFWVDGKAKIANVLTKLHGEGYLLRAVCRQASTLFVETPEIIAARHQERKECERVPRVKSPLKIAGACGRNVDTCNTNANCDLTRNTFFIIEDLQRHPAIRFKDKSERSVLLLPCTHLCGVLLLVRLWCHWNQLQFL